MKFDLTSPERFRISALRMVADAVKGHFGNLSVSAEQVRKNLKGISVYPNVEGLRLDPAAGDILPFGPQSLSPQRLQEARDAQLTGGVFVEDPAGGQIPRLGNKYLLTPAGLKIGLEEENGERQREGRPQLSCPVDPLTLFPLSIGTRHKLQYAYRLIESATSAGLNPSEVLKSQWILTTLDEENALPIIRELVKFNFLGFDRSKMLFMVQRSYMGMEIAEGGVRYSPHSPWYLWNHGDIAMTSTMSGQVFRVGLDISGEIKKAALSDEEFGKILGACKVKISYPISYLDPVRLEHVALAVDLGEKGNRMIMELVRQKPSEEVTSGRFEKAGVAEEEIQDCLRRGFFAEIEPDRFRFNPGVIPPWVSPNLRAVWLASIQAKRGGFWAFDQKIARGVVVESDHGGEVIDDREEHRDTLTKIEYMSNGFHLFYNPREAWTRVKESGLRLHLTVRDGYIYLCPPLGEQNLLVQTSFFTEEGGQGMKSLKARGDIPKTVEAMLKQDQQTDFRDLAESFGALPTREGRVIFSPLFIPYFPPFADFAEQSKDPIPFERINFAMFLDHLTDRARDHLQAAFEICEVVGSLVCKYEIARVDREEVYLETIPETMKGEGKKYPTSALSRVPASDSKEWIAKNAKHIHVGERYGFVIIDVPVCQSSRDGEIITFIVRFKETSKERLAELFDGKLRRVIELISDKGITGREGEIREAFVGLPVRDIFIKKASELAGVIFDRLAKSGSRPV